jgi:mRNA interferase RelE/StbE
MSRYTIYVTPRARDEIKALPGHVRQRVKRAVGELADDPRPPSSKRLNLPDIQLEVYRMRLDRWRVLYVVADTEETVDVLAVRKRPPYDYGDLSQLLEDLQT